MSYGKLYDDFWDDDEKAVGLSDSAALFAAFLFSGKHRNAIGCFKLGVGAITDIRRFKKWGIEGVSKALLELETAGLIVRDKETGWTLIVNALKRDGIKGAKAAIHAAKLAYDVPANSVVYPLLKERLEPQLQAEEKALSKAVGWPMKAPSYTPPKGLRSPEPEPEPEPQPEPEPSEANASGAGAPPPSKSENVSRETLLAKPESDDSELLDLPDGLRQPNDPWKAIYAGLKRHLGTRSGGLISKIRGVSNLDEMRGWLGQLDRGEIADGHEYFGKILTKRVVAQVAAGRPGNGRAPVASPRGVVVGSPEWREEQKRLGLADGDAA